MAEDEDDAEAIMFMSHPEAAEVARKHRSGRHLMDQVETQRQTPASHKNSRGSSTQSSNRRLPSESSSKSHQVDRTTSRPNFSLEPSKPPAPAQTKSWYTYTDPSMTTVAGRSNSQGGSNASHTKFMPSTYRDKSDVEEHRKEYRKHRNQIKKVKAQADQIRKEARNDKSANDTDIDSWGHSRQQSRKSDLHSLPRQTPESRSADDQRSDSQSGNKHDNGSGLEEHASFYDNTGDLSNLIQDSAHSLPKVSSDMPEDLKEAAAKDLVRQLRKDSQRRKKKAEKIAKADSEAIQMVRNYIQSCFY